MQKKILVMIDAVALGLQLREVERDLNKDEGGNTGDSGEEGRASEAGGAGRGDGSGGGGGDTG